MSASTLRLAYVLSIITGVLAAVASAGGLFFSELYQDNDLVITAWKGNDLITLVVVVPLLTGALLMSARGSERASLVWIGCVGYMLYTYIFYLYGAAFNLLFLMYVALVAISLYAFILGLMSLDVGRLSGRFRADTPVKWIASLILMIPLIMGGIELQRVVSSIFTGQVPADILQTGHPTAVVYATDLALLMPAIAVAAVMLWRRRPWGYAMAPVLMVKGVTYPLALIAMSLLGANDPLTLVYAFFWLLSATALGLLLWNLRATKEDGVVKHSGIQGAVQGAKL
jgi:hypothetical protein